MQKAADSFKRVWQQPSKRASHIMSTAARSAVSYCGEVKGREIKWLMLTTISFGPSREMLVGRNFRNGGELYLHCCREGLQPPSQTNRKLYSSRLGKHVQQISTYTYEAYTAIISLPEVALLFRIFHCRCLHLNLY